MSATYTYKVVDRSGGSSVGELVGESKAAVAAQLRLRGLTVVDVNEKITTPTVEDILDRYKKVKTRHITVMARQLATMVSSASRRPVPGPGGRRPPRPGPGSPRRANAARVPRRR